MNVDALATAVANSGNVQWGDVATWVASVGTVLAVVVALIQVARERRARLAQEARDRAARHRAHATLISAWLGPAKRIPLPRDYSDSGMDDLHNYRTPIYIHNSSAEPIYEIVAGIVFIRGAGGPRTMEEMLDHRRYGRQEATEPAEQRGYSLDPVTTAGIVPPGTWRVWVKGKGWTSVMAGRGGVDVAFVDRAGVSWVRRAMGQLDELPERPLEHFDQHGLREPYELQTPESTG